MIVTLTDLFNFWWLLFLVILFAGSFISEFCYNPHQVLIILVTYKFSISFLLFGGKTQSLLATLHHGLQILLYSVYCLLPRLSTAPYGWISALPQPCIRLPAEWLRMHPSKWFFFRSCPFNLWGYGGEKMEEGGWGCRERKGMERKREKVDG